MKKLNQEKRQTFVIITHDPSIAESADRIIHLKDGLIEKIEKAPRRSSR